MTPNQSLFSSRMICSVVGRDLPDLLERGGLGHFALYLCQHACHSPVALGVAAELALGADAVEGRAYRGNGDRYHHEEFFPESGGPRSVIPPPGR